MAIEFHCRSCNNLVRTPDAAAGKKGKCPMCGTVMQIPLRSESPADPADAAPALPADVIEFACPHCANPVRIPAAMAGKKGKCPKCAQVVRIPGEPASTAAPQAPEKKVKRPAPQPPQQQAKPSTKAKWKTEEPASPKSQPAARTATSKPPSSAPTNAPGRAKKPGSSVKSTDASQRKQKAASHPASAEKKSSDKQADRIEVPCAKCGKKVRTPATAAGKKARCPACGAIFVIPENKAKRSTKPASPGLTILDDEPAGWTPVDQQAGGLMPLDDGLIPMDPGGQGLTPLTEDPMGGGLAPLNDGGLGALGNDPLGGPAWSAPPQAANPYTSPAAYSKPRRSGGPSPGMVMAPGIAMMIVAGINLMIAALSLVLQLLGKTAMFMSMPSELGSGFAAQQAGEAVVTLVILGVQIIGLIVVMIGGYKMTKMEGWGAALTGSILLMLPCTFCCMGFPFGLWALIILLQSDVKNAFS